MKLPKPQARAAISYACGAARVIYGKLPGPPARAAIAAGLVAIATFSTAYPDYLAIQILDEGAAQLRTYQPEQVMEAYAYGLQKLEESAKHKTENEKDNNGIFQWFRTAPAYNIKPDSSRDAKAKEIRSMESALESMSKYEHRDMTEKILKGAIAGIVAAIAAYEIRL